MDQKPIHYDGSVPIGSGVIDQPVVGEPFQFTDEMRQSISGNPYNFEWNK
ncbi:hypothetical protein [Bacillus sp. Marseille-P3661]|nr:hypothetical protein [Bacillus sp. Marseille-P3661]